MLPSLYWEDFQIGAKYTTPGRTLTEGAIDIMVSLAGFVLPMMLDEEAAKKTVFGTRVVPGRLVLLYMDAMDEHIGIFNDTSIAEVATDKVNFVKAVKAGDTIRAEIEITGKRETSKPDRGIIVHRSRCFNQHGELVVECEATHLMRRRPK